MSFPPRIAEMALVASGRHCCLCHKFCGVKIELHHIKPQEQGGEDSYENCIPLCFDCHAEVEHYNIKHPKGRKLSETELKAHRDKWYEKVCNTGGIIANESHIQMDRILFNEIRAMLPSTGSIQTIRSKSVGAGNTHAQLDQLSEFFDQVKVKPEMEFMDADLESMKIDLYQSIENFFNGVYGNTFPSDRHIDIRAISPEIKYSQPDKYSRILRELDSLSDKVCESYDTFIRLGRRKLGVN